MDESSGGRGAPSTGDRLNPEHKVAATPYLWDLQWFAEEKTEPPTPRRRQEARKEGQAARSADLTAALVLLAAVLAVRALGQTWIDEWRRLFAAFISGSPVQFSTPDGWLAWLGGQVMGVFSNLILFLLLPAAAGLATGFIQVGGLFAFKAVSPQWKRISPLEGFRRLFSLRSLVEGAKMILKIAILGGIGYSLARQIFESSGSLGGMDPTALAGWTGDQLWNVALEASLALLGLAILDAWYQRVSFERQLRMTKQEVKEEFKRTEGNPTIKRKIRERQRALAQRRMMQEVPKATVVITNPTHYAVALRYEPESMDTPVVIAKGADVWAWRIRETARRYGVPVVENPPLARRLHAMVEIGEAIPEVLFQAVAEVLAYVYRLRGWTGERRGSDR
ncbi:flagellar biosynthesis protein FlhB [Kyrpidia spormannii]|uniref:Flagellar biosynthetic protein FlhB n=1 Tax=Kyrpidia spormannii TaxID=2055160 RepID=A0A2K8N6M1_9BACL|nr:flagellar biosynthesis protein FlhB [Kyrpidia spormannii]ATY85011.1 flagellar biosynthesis protein FlhB [Kyrpidia spormannii]